MNTPSLANQVLSDVSFQGRAQQHSFQRLFCNFDGPPVEYSLAMPSPHQATRRRLAVRGTSNALGLLRGMVFHFVGLEVAVLKSGQLTAAALSAPHGGTGRHAGLSSNGART